MKKTFKFWYFRKVVAKDLKEAVKNENKFKLEFDQVSEEKEKVQQLEPCIGFTAYRDEEEHETESWIE